MKWIGQHIYDQVSRFRNDVYINGDYFYVTSDNSRFISTQANDPLVQIRNERADSNGARLRFMKQRLNEDGTAAVDGVDNDVCGTIEFYSYDDGTPSTQNYAQIRGTIHDATSGEESGKLALGVASHDGGVENGLVLTGGSVDTEVDVNVGNGTSSLTAIAGYLSVVTELAMGSPAVSAMDNAGRLLVAGQTNITSLGTLTNLQVDYINANASTLTITDSSDTGDYFSIGTTTHGATTLTTVDDDAASANFTVKADGIINLQAEEDYRFYNVSSGTVNTDDFLKLSIGTHGSATFETGDAAATAAHIELAADGNITLDSAGAITLESVTKTYFESDGNWRWWKAGNADDFLGLVIGTHGDATFTTVDAAAAAAHFEVAADGDITLDAAGTIKLEGPVRPTGQIQAVYSSFQASDLGTKHYLGFNDGDSENTDQAHVDMPLVCPVAGKLLSVSVRQTRDESDHTYTIRLETQATGVAHATGPTIVGTQSGTAPTNTNIVTYDFQSSLDSGDNIIDAGDYVYISIQSDSDPAGSTKYFFTCLFEWDYSSIT